MNRLLFFIALFLVLNTTNGFSQEAQSQNKNNISIDKPLYQKQTLDDLRLVKSGTVTRVIDPLRIELDRSTIVQLVNIEIHDFDIYEPGPFASAVQHDLKKLLKNKKVHFYQQKKKSQPGYETRMGYKLGHLILDGEDLWIQGYLLGHGYATVRPSAYNTEYAAEMMDLEHQARKIGIGLWQTETPYDPTTVENGLNSWGVIEGTIKKTATVRNKVFLNFGDNWRNDFTILLESDVRRKFARSGTNPLDFTDRPIRVRGWIESYNGPLVRLIDPVWLEFTDGEALPE